MIELPPKIVFNLRAICLTSVTAVATPEAFTVTSAIASKSNVLIEVEIIRAPEVLTETYSVWTAPVLVTVKTVLAVVFNR